MAGVVFQWHTERLATLVATVQRMVTRQSVNWDAIATVVGDCTGTACRVQYAKLVSNGKALSVRDLQRRFPRESVASVAKVPAPSLPTTEQEVETKTTESGTEARSVGSKIKTVDDLLRYIGADLTRFEIDKSEATKWDGHSTDPEGNVRVTELHRVFVRLKPKAGPNTLELVQSVIDGAFAGRKALPPPLKISGRVLHKPDPNLLHAIVIADPHVGKHAWDRETGHGDYDMGIAVDLLGQAAGELLHSPRRPARRAIWVVGDYFHTDTATGTTTRGTVVDSDGRVQKMIDSGARALFDIIEASAETAPTDVVLVPGNHDTVLTWALQRILQSHYRHDKRVTIDETYTSRKYVRWGKVLIGLTHGDKARKKLPALMARERPVDWGETVYREIHTGHLHEQAAIETLESVVVRTAPSLSAADAWHYGEGFCGSLRAMEGFWYHQGGALLGMDVASPTVKLAKRRAA